MFDFFTFFYQKYLVIRSKEANENIKLHEEQLRKIQQKKGELEASIQQTLLQRKVISTFFL